MKPEELKNYLPDVYACMAAHSQLTVLKTIIKEIDSIETSIQANLKQHTIFTYLKTVPGVGPILAMVILLETGSIGRFSAAGNYASYCRVSASKALLTLLFYKSLLVPFPNLGPKFY